MAAEICGQKMAAVCTDKNNHRFCSLPFSDRKLRTVQQSDQYEGSVLIVRACSCSVSNSLADFFLLEILKFRVLFTESQSAV